MCTSPSAQSHNPMQHPCTPSLPYPPLIYAASLPHFSGNLPDSTHCTSAPILVTLLLHSLVPSTTWQQPLTCLLSLNLQFPAVFPTDFACGKLAGRKSMGKLQGRLQVAWVSLPHLYTIPQSPYIHAGHSHTFMHRPDQQDILKHFSNLCCILATLLTLLKACRDMSDHN